MKPFYHSRIHAKKHGGQPSDYADIDDFIDSSKAVCPDMRHRALFHSAFGCYVVEQVFGRTRINSDGKEYSTRDIAEEHILQDLGFIPTAEQWLNNMTLQKWMSGERKIKRVRLED
jgi:primase-polymerase (primpol)-like protein